jgi:hypothetical protein
VCVCLFWNGMSDQIGKQTLLSHETQMMRRGAEKEKREMREKLFNCWLIGRQPEYDLCSSSFLSFKYIQAQIHDVLRKRTTPRRV